MFDRISTIDLVFTVGFLVLMGIGEAGREVRGRGFLLLGWVWYLGCNVVLRCIYACVFVNHF